MNILIRKVVFIWLLLRNSCPKGRRIETIDSASIPLGIKDIRKKAPIDQNSILQKDILFRSPSYASALEIGGHFNGLVE